MTQIPTEQHLTTFKGDTLGYKNLSKLLLDRFLLKMDLPNSFGVYGNWGSGKSTILHYIMEHISKAPKKYSTITTVYFEPWKYEYSDDTDLLFALLYSIKNKTKSKSNHWKRLLVNTLTVTSGLLKATNIDVKNVVQDLEMFENAVFKKHENWIDKIEEFKVIFRKAIEETLREQRTEKLIIFIDDLDRCLPENTVKILESIKNFLSVEKVLFVLAIDRRIVSNMVEKKYGLHHGYGDEYLMKIIQYHYTLPQGNTLQIIEQILTSHKISFNKMQLKYIAHFLQKFVPETRIIKHILYNFCMNLTLSTNARELLKKDTENTQLQFLFVSSYLLTKYSTLFKSFDNTELLDYICDCIYARINPNSKDAYSETIKRNTHIDTQDRKRLEEILQLTIVTGKETSVPPIIDTRKLNTALQHIQKIYS